MYRSLENVPLDHELETELRVMGGTYSIESLRANFLGNKYAEMLQNNPPRFHGFLWADVDKYIEKFGPDVVPLHHGPYQARTVAIPLIDAQTLAPDLEQLSVRQSHYFVAYHVLHDDHEGLTGDILVPFKNSSTEKQEHKAWKKITAHTHGRVKSIPLKRQMNILTGRARPLANKEAAAFASFAWPISERIGYIYTGLQAWNLASEDPDLTDEERAHSLAMAGDVTSRSLHVVEEARVRLALADHFISSFDGVFHQIATKLGFSYDEYREGAALAQY